MSIIHATYEAGVFRPTEPIALPEGCHVELHVVIEPMQGEPMQDQTYANPDQKSPENTKDSIEDQLAKLAEEALSNDWRDPPVDLAEDLDHYLHGTP